jgi:hypothetical protein
MNRPTAPQEVMRQEAGPTVPLVETSVPPVGRAERKVLAAHLLGERQALAAYPALHSLDWQCVMNRLRSNTVLFGIADKQQIYPEANVG